MADEISEPVKKVCAMLKNASSDTEKFAALFLVTKLVRGKECRAKAKTAIFEAIGFNFLKRLLLTTDVPVDCPPVVYKSVALSVLTVFCNEPELATHAEMLENIPVFLDIVQQADNTDYDDNLIVVREAYVCLKCIAAHEPGQKALFEVGAIQKMCEIYSHQSFQTDEALNILVSLVLRFGAASWGANVKQFHVVANKIALDFETDHTERKFELCQILNSLLISCPREEVLASASEESWSGSVYKGLFDILTSKIGKAQRNPALELASTILDVLGVEWSMSDEENPKKFFLLLMQLAAIEIRMQMDNKSFKQAFGEARLLTACFITLEICVNYIATDQLDLEQKEKQQIYTSLKGAFSGILSVLGKISQDKAKDSLPVQEKLFLCAIVRVLAAWLAQETSAMREQVYKLLPFILSIANETFYASKARRVALKAGTAMESESDPIGQIDILRIMLPALCHFTVEEQARKLMLKSKEDEVLFECMNFHWTIVHYKKPPVPKAERLKQKTQPEREITPEILEEMKDSRAAIISICNVFMNITVLEAKIVEESDLFNTLLKFLFTELPELKGVPENLVLQGNLAILGMLLLKQQSNRVKKNDFTICRYIQSTIRFLWDAYIVDESNDPTALVVSIAYKEYWFELMELWFLGMQTMSGVLAQIPWISEFAIESGWAEGIIETLKKVKVGSLQPNVKSAYEDFLCHLVDANNSVASVLKKADALKVCRNHRFMELGKKLFGD